jgi:HSP20 family protein
MSHSVDFWRNGLGNPWRDFGVFTRQLDRMFPNFGDFKNSESWLNPNCEVRETASHYEFKMDIPGIAKDAIKIDLHDNQLTISGERKQERRDDKETLHIAEVNYGSFSRSFTLPNAVDPERVEAKYENGVLVVNLCKASSPKSRQISVK